MEKGKGKTKGKQVDSDSDAEDYGVHNKKKGKVEESKGKVKMEGPPKKGTSTKAIV